MRLKNFPRANSTEHPASNNNYNLTNENISRNVFVDPAERIAQAIERALSLARETSCNSETSRLVSRMSTTKTIPTFSGDPLDWPCFKQVFVLSTKIGDYTETENLMRLYGTLNDSALQATKSLFATGHSADDIMKALEMRFGGSITIIEKIVNKIRDLPNLETGKMSLMEFASRLKNSVAAIEAFDDVGYLFNPELIKLTLSKMTSSMALSYANFSVLLGKEKSGLEKLAEYLYKQAEALKTAGIPNLFLNDNCSTIQSDRLKKVTLPKKVGHVFGTETVDVHIDKNTEKETYCKYCNRKNHVIVHCKELARLPSHSVAKPRKKCSKFRFHSILDKKIFESMFCFVF